MSSILSSVLHTLLSLLISTQITEGNFTGLEAIQYTFPLSDSWTNECDVYPVPITLLSPFDKRESSPPYVITMSDFLQTKTIFYCYSFIYCFNSYLNLKHVHVYQNTGRGNEKKASSIIKKYSVTFSLIVE